MLNNFLDLYTCDKTHDDLHFSENFKNRKHGN